MTALSIRINKERLLETIDVSSTIGTTKRGGLNRLALTEEDKEMRNIYIDWLREAQLNVRVDDFGNIYGRREGTLKHAPAIAIGSHLDTQPCGGRYDGILGVLTGLEVIRTLNDNDIETDYPIEIINFTNEEGARFVPPMLGSGAVTGIFEKNYVYKREDKDGMSFEQSLKEIGFMGDEVHRLKNIKYFIELHIEQGPILERENKSIGIVKGIQGNSWLTVNVIGETNHAGPTPMENRKDALVSAAQMIVKINELTAKISGLKITIGKINALPNITNVIPGEAQFSIDIRHEDDQIRMNAIDTLKENIEMIAQNNDVDVTIETDWHSNTVEFSLEVRRTILEMAKKLGLSSMSFFSGPGHDAKYMAEISNAAMIFLPSVNGVSHNENELTLNDDIEKGANLLFHTIYELANIKE